MSDPRLDPNDPAAAPWFRALHLDERASLGAAVGRDSADAGAERLDSWRTERGLDGDIVARRLATSGLELDELHALLGEDDDDLQRRALGDGVPEWLSETLDALASPTRIDIAWDGAPAQAGMLALVEPILAVGWERLRSQLADIPAVAAIPEAELLAPIRERLVTLIERTLILELHIAALREQLPAGTEAERYAAFVATLDRDETRIEILQTYPVVARCAHGYVQQWITGVLELAAHLGEDASALGEEFGESLGAATHISAVGSDPHNDGRHVWFVDFELGRRVVYKPRPGATEVEFQRFVERVNATGLEPQLATIHAVGRDHHVWLEHVDVAPLSGPDGMRLFHERQGAWLAVLWVLTCSDMHYENIRASGDHPIPVDHETILRDRVYDLDALDVDLLVEEWLGDSLSGIGLLPSPHWDAGFGGAIDQGGMGVGYEAAGNVIVPQVVDAGTADMRVEPAAFVPEFQPNRAQLGEALVDPRDRIEDIERGFLAAWEHIAQHREQLIDELERFRDAVVRIVLRPTQHYIHTLDALGHPEFLQDSLERERALFLYWMYPENQEWRRPIVESERRQMLAGDVPWFGTTVGRDHLLTGDGEQIERSVVTHGIDISRERLTGMSEQTRDEQLWVLRSALAVRGVGERVHYPGLAGDALNQAGDVLERVLDMSVIGEGRRSWVGIEIVGGADPDSIRFKPAGVKDELYDGVAGIALTLAAYARVSGDAGVEGAAREALATLRSRTASPDSLGAYDGAAGSAWVFLQLAEWLGDDALVSAAVTAAMDVDGMLERDRRFDIISGAAGAIPVLLALAERHPEVRAIAVRCGLHLLEHVHAPSDLPFERGFSHGPTGVAWALARLGAATGDARFVERADALLEAEDELLGDRWTVDGGDDELYAWCHGAPGIALGRADIARVLGREIDPTGQRAIAATIGAPVHDSHGVCHGELGNVETLRELYALTADPAIAAAIDARTERVAEQLRDSGARATMPRSLESPGLMTGLAGVAWELLRAAAPERLPSILLPGSIVR